MRREAFRKEEILKLDEIKKRQAERIEREERAFVEQLNRQVEDAMLQELDKRGSVDIIGPSQQFEPQEQPIVRDPSPPRKHRESKAPVLPKLQKQKKEGQESDSSSSDKRQPIPEDQPRDSLRLKADPLVRAAYEAPGTGKDEVAEALIKRFDVTEADLEAEREWFDREQADAMLAEARSRKDSEEKDSEEEIIMVEDSESENNKSEEPEIELTETEKIKLNVGELLENYETGATLGDILEVVRDVSDRRRQREKERIKKEAEIQTKETEAGSRKEKEVTVEKEVVIVEELEREMEQMVDTILAPGQGQEQEQAQEEQIV